MADQEIRRSERSFGYDMGLNVLANLVAATGLYLGAVYGRYIVKDRDLVVVSIAVVMVAQVAVRPRS